MAFLLVSPFRLCGVLEKPYGRNHTPFLLLFCHASRRSGRVCISPHSTRYVNVTIHIRGNCHYPSDRRVGALNAPLLFEPPSPTSLLDPRLFPPEMSTDATAAGAE